MILALAMQLILYPFLPETVAHNFGSNGIPNSWITKQGYLLLTSAAILLASLIFLTIESLMHSLPPRYVNFPYKDYWLTPRRKDSAFKRMSKFTDILGITTNIFLTLIFLLVHRANLQQPPVLESYSFILCLVIFLIFTIVWIRWIYMSFRPPPE